MPLVAYEPTKYILPIPLLDGELSPTSAVTLSKVMLKTESANFKFSSIYFVSNLSYFKTGPNDDNTNLYPKLLNAEKQG